jgi:diguanylate cyclase (GGDEF)-like protein
LNSLKAKTGQKLAVPPGNEQDEIGRLVVSINGMIDHLVSTLKTERQLRIEREVEERRFRTIFDNVETGIGNRRGYERRLSAIGQLRQSNPGYSCALMLLDLDHFKEANDSYGHAVGDRVLQHVAAQLPELVRKTDYVARLGGDEFVVLLDGADERAFVERLTQRFLERLNEPLMIDSIALTIGASVGIAVLGRDTNSPQQLIELADQAMYGAKQAARNTYRFYGG